MNSESLHELKTQVLGNIQTEAHKAAVAETFDEHVEALKQGDYRKELQEGCQTAVRLMQDMSQLGGNGWMDEESSLLDEGVAQMDAQTITEAAEALQSQAGLSSNMKSI